MTYQNVLVQIIEEAVAAYNRGDMDGYFANNAPGYIHHFLNTGQDLTLEQFKQESQNLAGSFSDMRIVLEDIVSHGTAESGVVVTRFRLAGTGKGTFGGVPIDGKQIDFYGYVTTHIRDGKIVEDWELIDYYTFMTQLGVLPAPAAASEA